MIGIAKKTAWLLLPAALAGCGLTGDLQRPPPLFGENLPEIVPAELPEGEDRDLPQLPPRQDRSQTPADSDELLGGPEQR